MWRVTEEVGAENQQRGMACVTRDLDELHNSFFLAGSSRRVSNRVAIPDHSWM